MVERGAILVKRTMAVVHYDSAEAQQLIEELQQEYIIRYGGRDRTPVDPGQFAIPDGAFLVIRVDGLSVGCAGLRRHDERSVEVKRMFVRVEFRGQGLARWLLTCVEDQARALGYRKMLMETGLRQPEAMALYESSGFEPVAGFGFYAGAPENRCYAKDL